MIAFLGGWGWISRPGWFPAWPRGNADQSDVETLCASVITTWSYDALGAGAEMVLSLSGMGTIDNAGG